MPCQALVVWILGLNVDSSKSRPRHALFGIELRKYKVSTLKSVTHLRVGCVLGAALRIAAHHVQEVDLARLTVRRAHA